VDPSTAIKLPSAKAQEPLRSYRLTETEIQISHDCLVSDIPIPSSRTVCGSTQYFGDFLGVCYIEDRLMVVCEAVLSPKFTDKIVGVIARYRY
jgi:hypothetical protein